jgi:Ni/Co efflux regulator RcnB
MVTPFDERLQGLAAVRAERNGRMLRRPGTATGRIQRRHDRRQRDAGDRDKDEGDETAFHRAICGDRRTSVRNRRNRSAIRKKRWKRGRIAAPQERKELCLGRRSRSPLRPEQVN